MKLFSLLVLFVCASANAQTRAIVSDVRMITQKTGSSPDTVLMRTITAGRKSRVEYLSGTGPMATQFPGMDAKIQLIAFSDSSFTITFVDTTAKTFFTFDPLGMMKELSKMTEAIGGGAKIEPTNDSTTVDSLGAGEDVAGYKTIHFRVRSTTKISAGVLGDSSGISTTQLTDTYHVPALKASGADSALEVGVNPTVLLASLAGSLAGMDQLISQADINAKRMRKLGPALKTVTQMRMNLGGMAIDSRTTTEALSYKIEGVPDNLLSVPAGYKKVEPSIGIPPGN